MQIIYQKKVRESSKHKYCFLYKDFLKWQEEDEEQKQFMDMVKTSPSYIDDADEKQNYNIFHTRCGKYINK